MFASGLESNVTAGLNVTLHDIFLQKIPDLLAKKYFLLYVDGIPQAIALLNFLSGLESHFMEHFVVSYKGAHHGLDKPSVEHERGLMNEV